MAEHSVRALRPPILDLQALALTVLFTVTGHDALRSYAHKSLRCSFMMSIVLPAGELEFGGGDPTTRKPCEMLGHMVSQAQVQIQSKGGLLESNDNHFGRRRKVRW